MKQTPLRRLFSLALAVLFISTAGAAETERVILNGDELAYEAETTEFRGPLKIQRRENMGFEFSANRPGCSEFGVN